MSILRNAGRPFGSSSRPRPAAVPPRPGPRGLEPAGAHPDRGRAARGVGGLRDRHLGRGLGRPARPQRRQRAELGVEAARHRLPVLLVLRGRRSRLGRRQRLLPHHGRRAELDEGQQLGIRLRPLLHRRPTGLGLRQRRGHLPHHGRRRFLVLLPRGHHHHPFVDLVRGHAAGLDRRHRRPHPSQHGRRPDLDPAARRRLVPLHAAILRRAGGWPSAATPSCTPRTGGRAGRPRRAAGDLVARGAVLDFLHGSRRRVRQRDPDADADRPATRSRRSARAPGCGTSSPGPQPGASTSARPARWP